MTEVHSCSYYCDRPECIKAQRDELRDRLGSMTDREIMQQALEALELLSQAPVETALDYADNAITTLRERLAQPEQEPLQFKCTIVDDAHPNGVPLSQWGKQPEQEPAQRTWVGLTDEERNVINRHNVYVSDLIGATEAKLKEKNNG